MDMLAAMRVFQKVASTLSFTEAGDLLGLAPSSVSRQLDGLEDELGVKLLTRTTRRLALTEAGEAYKLQVDDLLAELDAVHENIAAFGDELRGRLKVSAPRVFGKRLITPLIPEFLATHPKVTLELSLTDEYVDLVETDTDVVIRIGALGDSRLVSRPLGRYRRILVCTPGYLRERPLPRAPSDLVAHNCLRYRRAGERVTWMFSRPDGECTVEHLPQGDFVANDVEALLLATEAGLGVSMLPYWLVRDRLEAKSLVQLLVDYPFVSTMQDAGIHFVYSVNRRQSRKVHAFMEHVSGRLGGLLI
ncbi:LysR family transcriptional regulator [Ideonella dechloratans]|uniref:LysR family transcriptional regulator n=1 Tax=Ideonella dechloratans TaxID=36863 RepID=A0A643F6K6_IDEDE|nr:LysR family transcriptional regulator [Ideonella dechloratans]KAB0573925.1 LysR family transcriptional regulator [Ideonella dechloratans]UFU12003.1 LysR family transcriptional regulator [Ideonella dechloratans]